MVATRVGGQQEQVEHRRSGLLIDDPADLAAFGAAVNELLADPQEDLAFGAAGREEVRSGISPTRISSTGSTRSDPYFPVPRTVRRADARSTARKYGPLMSTATGTPHPALDHSPCPGAYYTDGIRLYRVAHTLLDPWKGECVELEDCMTLETGCYLGHALELLHLERVQPLAV